MSFGKKLTTQSIFNFIKIIYKVSNILEMIPLLNYEKKIELFFGRGKNH